MANSSPLPSLPSLPGQLCQLSIPCDSKESLSQQATDWHTPSPLQTIHALMYTFFPSNSYRSSYTDSLNANRESGSWKHLPKANCSPNSASWWGWGEGAHPLSPAADTPLESYSLWKHKLHPNTAPRRLDPLSPCHLLPTSLDEPGWFLSDVAVALLIAYWVTKTFVVQWETTVENTTKHPIGDFWFIHLLYQMDILVLKIYTFLLETV